MRRAKNQVTRNKNQSERVATVIPSVVRGRRITATLVTFLKLLYDSFALSIVWKFFDNDFE